MWSFPNHRIPDSRTFSATIQRVGDHGKFDSPRSDHVLKIEPEILQANKEEPNLSIRRLNLRVGVSTFIVYRTLHLYHVQHVHFGELLFVNDVAGRSTRYKIF
jgi:hypothetical protein